MTFNEICEINLTDTKITPRSRNCLINAGLTKVSDLIDISVNKLKKIPNLGAVGIREIIKIMNEYGFKLKGQENFEKKQKND